MKNRIIALDSVRNFRDFGAYPGAGGRQIHSETLYRSGQFGEASAGDINLLETLNIRLQADLRRADERTRHGHRWPGNGVNVLFSDKGSETDAPHINFLTRLSADASDAHEWMRDYYRDAPYRVQHVEVFRDWFVALENLAEGQAVVVNCAAGKDRTGILCALTHHVLGVDRDTIFADYELSNLSAEVETRLPEMARRFNQHIGKDYPAEVYRPFIGVDPAFLETSYASIEARSGSLDSYLSDTLGVNPARRDALRERLLG